jgi:50S ribosomal protein L16 3-hydroxylase
MIAKIQWGKRDIAEFAGRYLSEPKPNVFFDAPDAPLGRAAFYRQANKNGIALNPKSRLLFTNGRFFINGEAFTAAADEIALLKQLADQRRLAPARGTPPDALLAVGLGAAPPLPAVLRERLYDWYEAGWLEIETA